jgi:hypothetical protein
MAMRATVLAIALSTFAASASAADNKVSEACRVAMARDWSKVAGLQSQAAMKAALPLFSNLRAACANDETALDDLSLAEGTDQFDLENAAAAIAALDMHKPGPANMDFAQAEWLYLSATQATGDAARFLKERDLFIAAHSAALLKHPGISKLPGFETPLAKVDAYRTKDPAKPFVFIASPKDGGEPASMVAQFDFPVRGKSYFTYTAYACWLSSPEGGGELPDGKQPDYADVKAAVVKAFSEQPHKPDDSFYTPIFMPFGKSTSRIQICANARQVLPAFADTAPLTGSEYLSPGAALSEGQLSAMLQGSSDQKNRAIIYIQQHPDSVQPLAFIYMVGDLMARGDMEQAAFWYYVYQIRIQPWKTLRSEPSADYSNEIYGALAETVGRPLNVWAGSDFEGFRNLMLWASTYERKMPLYPGRPNGVDAAEWQNRIVDSRASHGIAMLDKYFPDTAAARAENEARRKANGLYVGPWASPGSPLPDDWR